MRGRIVAGLVLIAIAVGLLGDERGWWVFGAFLADWWPLVFVFIGFVHLFSHRGVSGFVFVAVGGLIILANLDKLGWVVWGYVWPIMLLLVGLMLLVSSGGRRGRTRHWRHRGRAMRGGDASTASGRVDRFAFLGGSATRVDGEFTGGDVTACMGGIELDLRDARLPPDGATLSATAIMGGIEVLVPIAWRVDTTGPALLGGVDNKARSAATGPTLTVKATAILGGIDIKNKGDA